MQEYEEETEEEEEELNKNLDEDLNPNLNKNLNKIVGVESEDSNGNTEEKTGETEEMEKIKETKKEDTAEKKPEEKQEKDYFKEEKKIEKLRQLVEAILFMSPQPIALKEIAGLCETGDLELISELIDALKKDFIERKSGIEIVRETEGYRMQVLSELEVKVSHLAGSSRFSKGVMKTLAYIAFKQPVKQSTIIKYRTNKAYDEIKILEEQGFISREKAGTTYVIKTTKKFLQYFGDNPVRLTKNPEFE
ncbi:MAG: SMC-Scp complex subunit ScpB [archaeon]